MTENRILKIGMIGLGDIAQKAYLPVLASRADIELHLHTRDQSKLVGIGAKFRVPHLHATVERLVSAGVDAVFVHAATEAHFDLVRTLLNHRIAVFVDKPIAYHLHQSSELVHLAKANHCTLFVGFNRRYAPLYQQLVAPRADIVVMQKNRVSLPDAPRRVVLDDFIHVVDTLRYVLPGEVRHLDVRHKSDGGQLHYVTVQWSTECGTALGIMNRMSGLTEETLEVMSEGFKQKVTGLSERLVYDGSEAKIRRNDWLPIHVERGFDTMCDTFLQAVRSGEVLDATDALATHELCEEIVARVAGDEVSSEPPERD